MSDEREVQAAQIEADRLKHLANARPTPSVDQAEIDRQAWQASYDAAYTQAAIDRQKEQAKAIEDAQMRAYRATLPQPKSAEEIEAEAVAKLQLLERWAQEAAREHAQRQAWIEHQKRQQIEALQAELG